MMQGFLFSSALADFLRLRRIAVWLALGPILFVLSKTYLYVSGEEPLAAFNDLSSLLVYRVLMLAAAVFASAVIAQEVEQKTIVYLVTRPVPRSALLLSRMAAAIVAIALVGLLCALWVSLATHGAQLLSNPYLWRDVKGLVVGALAYGSLFTLVSLMVNRAMIVNLIIAFLWETLTANMQGNIYKLSIFSYLKSIAEKPTSDSGGAIGVLSGNRSLEVIPVSTAWIVMALLVAVCAWWSVAWFSRFAYLPREDAE